MAGKRFVRGESHSQKTNDKAGVHLGGLLLTVPSNSVEELGLTPENCRMEVPKLLPVGGD